MARSQWHRFYVSTIAAPPELLFKLLSDLPNYPRWLPGSSQYGATTDVEPYPVRRGSRYHDGKPDDPGKDWWGTVTGFQPPGSVDFHHTIHVRQLRATIDVHIHYSLEADDGTTTVTRWLVLDIAMPAIARPVRALITRSFDKENVRTMAALKAHAEARPGQYRIALPIPPVLAAIAAGSSDPEDDGSKGTPWGAQRPIIFAPLIFLAAGRQHWDSRLGRWELDTWTRW